jgi:hypothetical protein
VLHPGVDERSGALGAYAALIVPVAAGVSLAAELGWNQAPSLSAASDPTFTAGGLIWAVNSTVDVDAGWRYGAEDGAFSRTWLAGLTIHL